MHGENRKEIQSRCKEQDQIQTGGLYRIHNTETGWKSEIFSTPNMSGQRSRMQFARNTNMPLFPALQAQWAANGAAAFGMEELELLQKKPDQSLKEFREDLEVLLELWIQKEQ